MATCAPHLKVGEKRLWGDVGLKRLSVLEFLHPHIIDDKEDELRSLSPRRLLGAAVGALGLVHCFRSQAYNSNVISINRRVVGANAYGFGKHCAIARCVSCHRPNEANEVVCVPCFVLWDL